MHEIYIWGNTTSCSVEHDAFGGGAFERLAAATTIARRRRPRAR